MRRYETPYYVIYSDLEGETVLEAIVRTSAMASEYLRLFRDFTGQINRKWDLYLYSNQADYNAAGGPQGSGGVFMQRKGKIRLMTFVQGQTVAWSTVQHEGTHQFVYKMIGDEVPIWVNEGLAEYFGESIFTGDAMVHGIVSPRQVAEVKESIRTRSAMPFASVMAIDASQWADNVRKAPYNQVWSMVHFLLHADNGKYAGAFHAYLMDIGRRGLSPDKAWKKQFGQDIAQFERLWAAWWQAYPDGGSTERYVEATFRTMTSFLVRYLLQGHTFETAQEFFDAAGRRPLVLDANTWLPRATLRAALRIAPRMGAWSLTKGTRGRWKLVCDPGDGIQWVGSFRLVDRRIMNLTVTRGTPKPVATQPNRPSRPARPVTSRPARRLSPRKADPVRSALRLADIHIEAGQTGKARKVLTDALQANPRSAWAQKARTMLTELE